MDYRGVDYSQAQGQRKSDSIKQKLALFTSNPAQQLPMQPKKPVEKPFVSLYERTLSLIAKLYNIPDFEYYLFPGGVNSLLQADSTPVIDPISILWGCFRLGAPLCHLLNQLNPKTLLPVPNVSGIVTYNNVCKKCIYDFIVGVKNELGITGPQIFSISEVYKDDTNGLVKIIGIVDLVLEEIESRGLASKPKLFPFALGQVSLKLQDNRSKAIAELLATERKYLESLNELMEYRNELESRHVISNDLVHKMFANLGELLDFQRRFLFSLEATLALPDKEQHIGAIFIQYEDGFQVYNTMCASYSNAIKLVLENQSILEGVGNIDPKSLQGYLIKPVQRICRYPLLLKEIIKLSSPESYPFCDELKEAELVMKKVTDQVNEVQRMEENKELKLKLMESIDDLQGLNANDWGDLLLSDKFPMTAHDTEQIYGIYLFENLILCCKEKEAPKSRRSKDSRTELVSNDIKGKIYSTSISDVVNTSDPDNGIFEIKVYWNDGEESFVLKCRNIEQVELWRGRILACATGNVNLINGRLSTDGGSGQNRSDFRRTVQSINTIALQKSLNSEADKRTASLPAMTRPTTKKGTQISPRGSSIYLPQFRKDEASRNEVSVMSPSISKSTKNEIPLVAPRTSNGNPRTQTPMPISQPPKSALPIPPSPQPIGSVIQSSSPARKTSPQPPSVPLPIPPQSPPAVLPRQIGKSLTSSNLPGAKPPTAAIPSPPSTALPQPPLRPAAVLPPSAPLPQPPSRPAAVLPPSAPLPEPPLRPAAVLPPSPPSAPLPQPLTLAAATQNIQKISPPKSSLLIPPGTSSPPQSALPTPPGPASIAKNLENMNDSMNNITFSSPPSATSVLSDPPKNSSKPAPTSRRASAVSVSGRNSAPGSSLIKLKIHYGALIFILAVPANGVKYDEVLDKVERKIKICGAAMPEGRRINLRYKDEENDFVMLNSDEDIEMAFEMARTHNDKGSVTIQAE